MVLNCALTVELLIIIVVCGFILAIIVIGIAYKCFRSNKGGGCSHLVKISSTLVTSEAFVNNSNKNGGRDVFKDGDDGKILIFGIVQCTNYLVYSRSVVLLVWSSTVL